ncbi:MAG: hypothetical protein QXX64_03720 [Nitrososphaera sp.]|uniref:Uncharacterized protein n=1 Tax=Nitrososphaera gargensis (strain Ga9.2) TaxID=1237085 RepID=K0IHJ4_NITGG|nr:hypothetical protein [Candidatus Nitrososphaera gargensis]AFU58373.1 hypothetical protein Ngar_c14370 [Candidatus Nitrososphaera gargensis Ga9.2]
MKKAPIAVALVLVFGLFAAAVSLAPAVAQNTTAPDGNVTTPGGNVTDRNVTGGNVTAPENETAVAGAETFSARGSIATLIFDTGEITTTGEMQNETGTTTGNETGLTTGNETGAAGNVTTSDNMTTTLPQIMTGGTDENTTLTADNETTTAQELEPPYVLAGDWSLDVQDGSVNNFAANFTMVHIDGTNRHTHEFSNFVSNNSTTIDTSGNGTSFIMGTVDISVDGETRWTGADALIIIERNNVISISVATEDTEDHFKGQPIYGIVESMTDENGNELIETGGAQAETAGNATGTGNQTGGNQTGGILENLTEGLQNLTGGQ